MQAPVTRKSGRKMDVHLLQMAEFIGFTEEDAELIRATGPAVIAHADEVTKVVYDHLLEQPGTYNFFRKDDGSIDDERVENRRKGLARWLARTADAKLDYSFAWHMVAMGIAHSHRMQKPMGRVPGPFIVGTMSYVQTVVGQILMEDLEDKGLAFRASIAWNKILMLELDLLLTGYYSVSPPPDGQ